jgi:thiol-disulfide isomerase/thioredoxin
MTSGTWALLAAVLLALGFGLYRLWSDGRFRGTHPVKGAHADEARAAPPVSVAAMVGPDVVLGERATLLQFSSAFCAPCRAARRTLADVAEIVPGVTHVEVDAESHLDVVRRLGILRTPTTLVLDAEGMELARASGAPSRDQVISQLGAVT